jgi:hypothetical protein
MEHGCANENALVTVVVAGESVADPVKQRDYAEAPPLLHEEMLEGTPHDSVVGERAMDQFEGVWRRERICVKEEKGLAAGDLSARVQEGGAGRIGRPEKPCPICHGPLGALFVTRGRDNSLGLRNSHETG